MRQLKYGPRREILRWGKEGLLECGHRKFIPVNDNSSLCGDCNRGVPVDHAALADYWKDRYETTWRELLMTRKDAFLRTEEGRIALRAARVKAREMANRMRQDVYIIFEGGGYFCSAIRYIRAYDHYPIAAMERVYPDPVASDGLTEHEAIGYDEETESRDRSRA